MGPTIVLVKCSNGRICGGFTNISWTSPKNGTFIKDDQAFLFSVDLKECHYPHNDENSVYHAKSNGPSFGLEELDFAEEPMNGLKNGLCCANEDGEYQIPQDSQGNSALTGQGSDTFDRFTCVECEIYSVSM